MRLPPRALSTGEACERRTLTALRGLLEARLRALPPSEARGALDEARAKGAVPITVRREQLATLYVAGQRKVLEEVLQELQALEGRL